MAHNMAHHKQELEDVPQTWREYMRQKGPMPVAGALLVIGLIIAFLAYYLPVIIASFND